MKINDQSLLPQAEAWLEEVFNEEHGHINFPANKVHAAGVLIELHKAKTLDRILKRLDTLEGVLRNKL